MHSKRLHLVATVPKFKLEGQICVIWLILLVFGKYIHAIQHPVSRDIFKNWVQTITKLHTPDGNMGI